MERKYLIPHEGNFYKANLHCHSTCSDGLLTPAQLKDLYKSNGYSILAYTDHNVLNYFKEFDEPNFLVLCGYEVDRSTKDCGLGFPKTCHLNAIAKDPAKAVYIERPADYTSESINGVIRKMVDAGYIVNYNHPGWSAEEPSDFLRLTGCTAMEIYNNTCEILSNDGNASLFYSIMLKHRMRLFCIATDDNHNFNRMPGKENWPCDNLGGWTMIKAPELTYPSIIQAFLAGEFYCSTGPQIYDYYLEGDTLCIDCSPVRSVYLRSAATNAPAKALSSSNDITHAEFDLTEIRTTRKEPFVRIEIVDSTHKTAYTNPLFF